MGSLGLSAYLALSARAEGAARRALSRRLSRGKEDPDRFEERLGHASAVRPAGRLIWFHAASVGESLSVLELIRRLLDVRPDVEVLVTTGTRTSAELMAVRLPPRARHQYAPVDALPALHRFLDHWSPDLAVWTESEIWPAMLHATHARGVPMVAINARISDRSARAWRWMPGMAASLLARFERILTQDEATAAHLRRLGARRDRVEVAGSLKEGSAPLPHDPDALAAFARRLAGRPVWLAASTHPGEEAVSAEAHRVLLTSHPTLLLILVPRHPDRGPGIAADLRAAGWRVAQRSAGEPVDAMTQIYLADTLGELGLWYRLAPVSFVGGSLVQVGGHNPYEPAALGSAILYGPHVANFADVYQRLDGANAAVRLAGPGALAPALGRTLTPERAAALAANAWTVTSDGAEVTDRVLAVLSDALGPK